MSHRKINLALFAENFFKIKKVPKKIKIFGEKRCKTREFRRHFVLKQKFLILPVCHLMQDIQVAAVEVDVVGHDHALEAHHQKSIVAVDDHQTRIASGHLTNIANGVRMITEDAHQTNDVHQIHHRVTTAINELIEMRSYLMHLHLRQFPSQRVG